MPTDPTTGHPCCGAGKGDYICVRARGHSGKHHTNLEIVPGAMSGFEAGEAYAQLQAVARGVKPAAVGWIRADALDEFLALRDSGFRDLHVGFGPVQGDPAVIEWRVSRHLWGVKALAWLDENGGLDDFHRHWIQGLLFGYSADEIDRFLSALPDPPASPARSRRRRRERTWNASRI